MTDLVTTISDERLAEMIIAAYRRGHAWRLENPGSEEYLAKAAYDYADKTLSSLEASPSVDERDATNLLSVIADIREKTGVGAKPMLSELADAIAARIEASPAPAGYTAEDGLRRVREIALQSEAAPLSMGEIIKVVDMALSETTPFPDWLASGEASPAPVSEDMVERLIEFATDVGRHSPKIVPMGANPPLFDGMQDDTDGAWLNRVGTVKRIRSFFAALAAKGGQ